MIAGMKVRSVSFAYVSAAFLAATAMIHGTAFATSSADYQELVRQAYQDLQQGDATKAIGEFSQAIDSGSLEPEVAVAAASFQQQHAGRGILGQSRGQHAAGGFFLGAHHAAAHFPLGVLTFFDLNLAHATAAIPAADRDPL